MTDKKPNPIEEAIGERAKTPSERATEAMSKQGENWGAKTTESHPKPEKPLQTQAESIPLNDSLPSEVTDEPTPTEMLALEELNRQTEERLKDDVDQMEEAVHPKPVQFPTKITHVLKSDPPPETETCSQESPPQKIDASSKAAFEITKNVEKSNAQTPQEVRSDSTLDQIESSSAFDGITENLKGLSGSAEDIEFTALRKYIFEDGFVVATVAFHVVTLCAQPMVTPSTTTWDFVDRAAIPDMVFSLLQQPGYLEGIWPSLKIIMGSNKGNAAWCAGIATTIAFFDVVRTLPTLKDMNNEDEKKS